MEDCTDVGEETFRRFFHKFIFVGATTMYDKWVRWPITEEEIKDCMTEFDEAGLTGCIGSTDATHVIVEKLQTKLKNNNLGNHIIYDYPTHYVPSHYRIHLYYPPLIAIPYLLKYS
jgi:hypothetical protein